MPIASFLFSDADTCHGPASVASLVADAEANDRDLVSHMVKLSAATLAERLLIPAFVFSFFTLYPPAWITDPQRRLAAAAGGCVLIRPEALARAGDCKRSARISSMTARWPGWSNQVFRRPIEAKLPRSSLMFVPCRRI